ADGELIQETSTDSNGYYGFNVEAGEYSIEFVKPEGFEFTEPNIGYEETDSDAEQATGRTDTVQVDSDVRLWDAGLIPLIEPDPAEIPPAQIGPVRSARLIHIHLQNFLQESCLIYAGATEEIEGKIPGCATVFKRGDGGMGAMLDISRMKAISEDNYRKEGSDFNYAHNLFAAEVPIGGKPAMQVDMFFSQLNQSKWVYDPTYQGWLRYVDNTSELTDFHVDTDRLSGRQIYFENLIVLFVEHEVLAPAIIDMYLQQGEEGNGFAFRDGQMFGIEWSTRAGKYEQETGFRLPIAFREKNGDPFPLRPGRSWIVIATPFSDYSQNEPGKWNFRIYAPPGAGIY
ncbi:MAG: SdrD B-like domain-containing protein, partial [Anaerolineales bacterium]